MTPEEKRQCIVVCLDLSEILYQGQMQKQKTKKQGQKQKTKKKQGQMQKENLLGYLSTLVLILRIRLCFN